MVLRQFGSALIGSFLLSALFVGCGSGIKQEPNQKPTFKVTGSVVIDGQTPSPPVRLVCHVKEGAGTTPDKAPSCESKTDGTFELVTYRDGDGAPAGEYLITAEWREYDLLNREYKNVDKLKGRYRDPKKSQITFTVVNKPVDLGTIELTTK